MRRQRHVKWIISALFVVTITSVTVFAVYTHAQSANIQLDAQITARISINNETDALRNDLSSLIWYAERLIGDTFVSPDGFCVSPDRFWATSDAHYVFQSAINEANTVFRNTDALHPGDTFTATISTDGNTGFASMLFRIRIPSGLELIGTMSHNLLDMDYGLELPECANGIPPSSDFPLSGDIFAGWAGRSSNFYGNGELFTFTFRVTGEAVAGQTVPIMVAFANGTPAYELPADVSGRELKISLNSTVLGLGESTEIGRVTFGQISHGLSVSATPSHQTIVNRVGESVSFGITVSGMPTNQIFDLANPCLDTVAGITVEGLPPGIEVSGEVVTNESGDGAGILTLRIYDASVEAAFDSFVSSLGELFPVHGY